MPAFTVLRIAKLKTWGAVAATDLHNARKRETPNADNARTPENRLLIGSPEQSAHDGIKERLASQRIRSNAVSGRMIASGQHTITSFRTLFLNFAKTMTQN